MQDLQAGTHDLHFEHDSKYCAGGCETLAQGFNENDFSRIQTHVLWITRLTAAQLAYTTLPRDGHIHPQVQLSDSSGSIC